MNPERIRVGDHVTIYKRGKRGIWCADFWRDGQHRRQSLKTTNQKVALERARRLEVTLADDTYQKPIPSMPIRQAIEDYLRFVETENLARKSIVKYGGILRTLADFLDTQRATKINQFSANLFDRFRSERKPTHHPKSMYTEGVVIKQFFKWAKSRLFIANNPIENFRLTKPPLEPKSGPSLAQINQILATCDGNFGIMLAVLAFTGMRSGELQRLRPEDLDFDDNWIHVVSRRGAETKTRTSRKIPIHPRLRAFLQRLPKRGRSWLFTAAPSRRYPDGDHHISTKRLNERFQRVLKRLAMHVGRHGGFTIHSLRHSFETIAVNAGIPQRVIDTWLGHRSDQSMAAVYYRLSDEDSQRFMLKVPFDNGDSAAGSREKG